MRPKIEDGVLVLADISGFTAFVTATELEHGPPIIAALLEEVMGKLAPPLEIQEVEGDAVFALGPDRVLVSRERLLDVLESAFAAFRQRQREMQAVETCPCNVCTNISVLDLKIVAHHGSFLRHAVGGRSQAAGINVILAHRLLKNRLEGKGPICCSPRPRYAGSASIHPRRVWSPIRNATSTWATSAAS
jgi:hypothetical protein